MVKRRPHIRTFLDNETGISLVGMSLMYGLSSIHLQKSFFLIKVYTTAARYQLIAAALYLFGLGMRRDKLAGLDVIDVRRPHLHAGGLLLQQERDTAVFVTPATVERLHGDLLGQAGHRHGDVELPTEFIGHGNIFVRQGRHEARVIIILPEDVPRTRPVL